MIELEHDRQTRIRRTVRKAAQELGLELEFLPPRRTSDLTFVVARGERHGVQELPVRVLDALSAQADVELISCKSEEASRYRMTFGVTNMLASQPLHAEERRAKLRLVQRDLLKDA